MNEQDTQTVERVAKAINGPHDSSHIGIEELHELQEYRWKRQTTNAERARCLNQARAAISAMPDTTAQADTIKALVEALELANAALEGANMNMNVVFRKVRNALSAAKETQ